MTEPKTMRAFTGDERRALAAFVGVRFIPASFDKRFVRDMTAAAERGGGVTAKQAACLWRTVYRYRRQIRDTDVIRMAEERR